MGLLAALLGPISEFFYTRDYWTPQYAFGFPWIIEDFLFAFLAGSGASTAYQVFLGKRIGSKKFDEAGLKIVLLLGGIGLIITFILNIFLGVNSLFAGGLAMIFLSLFINIKRPDLRKLSLVSGVLISSFAFLFYLIVIRIFPQALEDFWLLRGRKLGITPLGIPLTEIFWAFCAGIVAGPIYEYWFGFEAN